MQTVYANARMCGPLILAPTIAGTSTGGALAATAAQMYADAKAATSLVAGAGASLLHAAAM